MKREEEGRKDKKIKGIISIELIIILLIGVAYITLAERKIMG